MSLPEEISLQVEASLSFGKRVELAVSRKFDALRKNNKPRTNLGF